MAGEPKPTSNPLEQFILLSKAAKGPALTALIIQVLEAPGVYVFGELLETPNVQELANGSYAAYFQLLNLFAYGTYPDYLDLDMKNLRELEDLIIEAIYTDIIQGKLDQRNQLLEVDFCIGRDLQKQDINDIVKTLQEWCDCCQVVLLGIEQQVLRVNQYKESNIKTQQQMETEVANIKKTLKATASSSSQDADQHPMDRDTPQLGEQRPPTKKLSKVKGLASSRH
ncbi:COP9 signalosome complex subunit 7a isoform X3 [Callorhinchus milii]|uniref:COP9 signalosome complex subunit 7a isoform X3 n=1 Tax=Callorhinchus milii TaxID=7868 RepID=UPI000457555B|nr:COP9 signalosome complex subunit 7a isoform X3 [Callorhinchus milii]|eukprot:gi/632968549/ref/XP_007900587.1/ PREDICTED: COP9 signalosome complex subunit 7b isoform X3 [Callorhinchus milii]